MKKLEYKLQGFDNIDFYYKNKILFSSYGVILLGGENSGVSKYILDYMQNTILIQDYKSYKKHIVEVKNKFKELGFYVDVDSILNDIKARHKKLITESIQQLEFKRIDTVFKIQNLQKELNTPISTRAASFQ